MSAPRRKRRCSEKSFAAPTGWNSFGAADIESAKAIVERYGDLRIGLADASIVVLAERHHARDVLTLDERRFRALRIGRRQRFRILPADRPAKP